MNAKTPSAPEALVVTLDEGRSLIGVSKATMAALLRNGDIPVVRFGPRTVRIRRVDLEDFVARRVDRWDGAEA